MTMLIGIRGERFGFLCADTMVTYPTQFGNQYIDGYNKIVCVDSGFYSFAGSEKKARYIRKNLMKAKSIASYSELEKLITRKPCSIFGCNKDYDLLRSTLLALTVELDYSQHPVVPQYVQIPYYAKEYNYKTKLLPINHAYCTPPVEDDMLYENIFSDFYNEINNYIININTNDQVTFQEMLIRISQHYRNINNITNSVSKDYFFICCCILNQEPYIIYYLGYCDNSNPQRLQYCITNMREFNSNEELDINTIRKYNNEFVVLGE
jgi:hypothetical protein